MKKRPDGIDEKIKNAQMKRFANAGCSKRESRELLERFKNQYLNCWREYVDLGLIEEEKAND